MKNRDSRERDNAAQNKRRAANREKINAAHREWYANNLGKVRAKHRLYQKRWRTANIEKARAKEKKWQLSHRAHVSAYRKKYDAIPSNKLKKRAYRLRNYALNKEKINALARRWRAENPAKHLLQLARSRAKTLNIECSITIKDIVIPQFCPVLGIELVKSISGRFTHNSPTLDRINNSLGYIPGNVAVISHRANALKRDMTIATLNKIIEYIKSHSG